MTVLRALSIALALLAGCTGPGHVEFVGGECRIDGTPATLPEVEARQARISERILSRQPWFVVVTVLVVALAGMSHIEKLVLLLSTRKAHVHGLGERLRLALDRYRASPVRYFSVVAGTLLLLLVTAGFYVYLDADKRASERALGLLQFCHVALRNKEAQNVLSEQRHNLEAIESTAGTIRALVDKLPPEEQRKAHEIVTEMNAALAQQGKLVSDYLERTDAQTKAVREHTELLERGLSSVESSLTGLKSLPAEIREIGSAMQKLSGQVAGIDGTCRDRIASMETTLKTLAARPSPKCPDCVCAEHRRMTAPSVDGGAPPAR